jgi:hypothetical protein
MVRSGWKRGGGGGEVGAEGWIGADARNAAAGEERSATEGGDDVVGPEATVAARSGLPREFPW